jgi:demethylmenaquinone methyltransferase/2-methoxy-6-polyprenyl-1,4-benzoquinol methylase
MTNGRGTALAERFFSGNGATYDQIANLSTLGLDLWWKRIILARIPAGSRTIIDQACGTGILTFKIARRFPRSRVVGVELQEGYLEVARKRARDLHLDNVDFILGRAEDVVLGAGVDCITSSYLAKYADLDRLVANARGMLRSDGVLIVHELTYPASPVLAGLWRLHLRLLQTYGARRYPEWEIAFRELPALLRESRWVDDLTRALSTNHFSDIAARPLAFDASTIVTARR